MFSKPPLVACLVVDGIGLQSYVLRVQSPDEDNDNVGKLSIAHAVLPRGMLNRVEILPHIKEFVAGQDYPYYPAVSHRSEPLQLCDIKQQTTPHF